MVDLLERAEYERRRAGLALRLDTAKHEHGQAAHEAVIGNKLDKKRLDHLLAQIGTIEAEIVTLDAAYAHAESIRMQREAEARRQREEQEREDERRQRAEAVHALRERSVAGAEKIDRAIDLLAEGLREWCDPFDAGRAALLSTVNPARASALASTGAQGLLPEITNRLIGIGVVRNTGVTTADMQVRIQDRAREIAERIINATQVEV